MECEAQSPGSRTALFVLQLSCSWHLQVLLLLQYSYQGTGEVIYYQSVFAHTTVTSIENIRALKPKRTYGNRSIVNTGVSLLVGFFNKQRAKNICMYSCTPIHECTWFCARLYLVLSQCSKVKTLQGSMSFVGEQVGKLGGSVLCHEKIEGMHTMRALRLHNIFPRVQPLESVEGSDCFQFCP